MHAMNCTHCSSPSISHKTGCQVEHAKKEGSHQTRMIGVQSGKRKTKTISLNNRPKTTIVEIKIR